MAAPAMGAGEARFRLYRRVWSVAGLNDAMAIGLAVTEATFLITLANALMPAYQRPYRLAVPLLATPAIVIGIGLFRLLPRLLSRVPASGNRLLVVVQNSNGYATVKALAQHPNPDWKPIAIVTRRPDEQHKTVLGIPVLGSVAALRDWLKVSLADGVAFVLEDEPVAEQRDSSASAPRLRSPSSYSVSEQWFPRQRAALMRQLSADDLVGRAMKAGTRGSGRAHPRPHGACHRRSGLHRIRAQSSRCSRRATPPHPAGRQRERSVRYQRGAVGRRDVRHAISPGFDHGT
jgi:FlaA1/EpsC-like NDP-sugar epimerase